MPDLPGRDLDAALARARAVVRACGDADSPDTLAAVHAARGRFDLAVREATLALADADAPEVARWGYRRRLDLYRQGILPGRRTTPVPGPRGESVWQGDDSSRCQ